jgi:ATP-dependent Lon protease
VIKESGELALSYVKIHAYELCITNSRSEDPLKLPEPIDIHLHLPAGAQKKDGPSAGVAMVRFGFFFSSVFFDIYPDRPINKTGLCICIAANRCPCAYPHRDDWRGKIYLHHLRFKTIMTDKQNTIQITLRGRVTPVGGIKEKACLL